MLIKFVFDIIHEIFVFLKKFIIFAVEISFPLVDGRRIISLFTSPPKKIIRKNHEKDL